jgi:hypothetical protein
MYSRIPEFHSCPLQQFMNSYAGRKSMDLAGLLSNHHSYPEVEFIITVQYLHDSMIVPHLCLHLKGSS